MSRQKTENKNLIIMDNFCPQPNSLYSNKAPIAAVWFTAVLLYDNDHSQWSDQQQAQTHTNLAHL